MRAFCSFTHASRSDSIEFESTNLRELRASRLREVHKAAIESSISPPSAACGGRVLATAAGGLGFAGAGPLASGTGYAALRSFAACGRRRWGCLPSSLPSS